MAAPTPTGNMYPTRLPLTAAQISAAMAAALKLQRSATTQHSKRPFAAVLLGPDNETILLSHTSVSHIRHAETSLARLASDHYSQSFLWKCTLVSTWEPCAMCAGTLYWANIGGLVYGARETELRKLTGKGNPENVGFDLPCREVLEQGQKELVIIGPVEGWEEQVVQQSDEYWKPVREQLGIPLWD